jgi:hypothetical protein
MRLIAIAAAAIFAAGAAFGFDAAGVEIIGLHLGMYEAEVVTQLKHQGVVAIQSGDTISAKTMDGRLQVVLSAERTVTEIRYAFGGRGVGGPAGVREAVLTHFGDPNQASPPAWCREVRPDGHCPADQASLTFDLASLTLVLRVSADPAQ